MIDKREWLAQVQRQIADLLVTVESEVQRTPEAERLAARVRELAKMAEAV